MLQWQKLSGMNYDELIQACLRGERSAQKQLYDKFAGKLYAVALRYMKTKEEAEDVLQEAFIKIYKKLGSFRADCPLEVWLKRVVINTSITALNKRKVNYDINDFAISDGQNVSLASLGFKDLMQLINALPDGCKTIFNLFAIEGYKHNEIAEMLGISEGTSKSQMARARAILMEKIELENIRTSQ